LTDADDDRKPFEHSGELQRAPARVQGCAAPAAGRRTLAAHVRSPP